MNGDATPRILVTAQPLQRLRLVLMSPRKPQRRLYATLLLLGRPKRRLRPELMAGKIPSHQGPVLSLKFLRRPVIPRLMLGKSTTANGLPSKARALKKFLTLFRFMTFPGPSSLFLAPRKDSAR
jgi:hypothetical protein